MLGEDDLGGRFSCHAGGNRPLKPGETLEVIGQVRYADLDAGAGDADGAHDKSHAMLLTGEHMLDRRAYRGSPGIGPRDPLGHRPAWLLLLVNMPLVRNASFFFDR